MPCLALGYNTWLGIRDGSTVWPQLAQLQSLEFGEVQGAASAAVCHQVVEVVATLSGLTRFVVYACDVVSMPGDPLPLVFGKHLAKLRNLQELVVDVRIEHPNDGRVVPEDSQHLTALTLLTHLYLRGAGDFVTDPAVVLLALHLKQLESFTVLIKSAAVLPVIGGFLINLNYLHVMDLPVAEQQSGLPYLTGMKQLTQLNGSEACSSNALQIANWLITGRPCVAEV